MELAKMEHYSFNAERLSTKALRHLLGELAVYETMTEAERVEAIIARVHYQLRLREGQGLCEPEE